MPLHFVPPCQICGEPYVDGSDAICRQCLLGRRKRSRRRKQVRFRCDCGALAEAVVLVRIGSPEGDVVAVRMALCPACLDLERENQEFLDSLGKS